MSRQRVDSTRQIILYNLAGFPKKLGNISIQDVLDLYKKENLIIWEGDESCRPIVIPIEQYTIYDESELKSSCKSNE